MRKLIIVTALILSGCSSAPSETNKTADCVIKGNISQRTGEKIYHLPHQQYYDRTIISKSDGERFFCTEKQARKAGWRKSKR